MHYSCKYSDQVWRGVFPLKIGNLVVVKKACEQVAFYVILLNLRKLY